jgi:hypothetical protein
MKRREALTAIAAAVVAAAAPAAVLPDPALASPWRVFRVSDYEWYVARSPLEALMCAAGDWGCPDVPAELGGLLEDLEREGLADSEPEEVDLDALRFTDVDEHDNPCGSPRTFREELAQRVALGLDEPELFAAAEW